MTQLKDMLSQAQAEAIRSAYAAAGDAAEVGSYFTNISRHAPGRAATCRLCGREVRKGTPAALRFEFNPHGTAFSSIRGYLHHSGCVHPSIFVPE